jgi:hypothetical protein
MSRETAQNVLIGSMLLLILGGGFAVCTEAFGLALYSADLAVKHYFPAVAHPSNIEFFGFISLVMLIGCARQMRKRLWTNAFLSLVAVVTIVLPWLLNANPHPALGSAALRFPLVWLLALILPQTTRTSRGEFIGCASILAVAFAINSGLLGSGLLEIVIEISLCVGIARWVMVRWLAGSFGDPWRVFSQSNT